MAPKTSEAKEEPIWKKIAVEAIVAVIAGVIGAFLGWIFASNSPPVAEVSPPTLSVRPDDYVQFDARGSHDLEGKALSYTWSAGGVPLEEMPFGYCHTDGPQADCRFVLPGTFGISVEVTDEAGLKSVASSSVTVIIEAGYIALRVADKGPNSDAVYRALLAAVDWREVQAHTRRLLVFHDPDKGHPVYASTIVPNPDADLSALNGMKVMLPFSDPAAIQVMSEGLSRAGASFSVVSANDAIHALSRGAANIGFVPVAAPELMDDAL